MKSSKSFFLLVLIILLSTPFAYSETPITYWNTIHPTHSSHLGLRGHISSMSQHTYDATLHDGTAVKGARKEAIESGQSFLYNYSVSFDLKGKIGRMSGVYHEDRTEMKMLRYGKNAQCLSEVLYAYGFKGEETIKSVCVYEYIADTLSTAWMTRKSDEKYNQRTTFEYPSADTIKCSSYFYESCELITESIQEGRISTCLVENMCYEDNLKTFHQYTYNTVGDVVQDVHTQTFEFNGIAQSDFKGKNQVYTYIYTYDEQHNWISRVHYIDGQIETITERKINYRKE